MIKNVFARYLVLLTVGGSLLGGAALGLAGMANAAVSTNGATGPGYSYVPERQGQAGADPEAGLAQPPRRLAHQRPQRQVTAQHDEGPPRSRGGPFRMSSPPASRPAGAWPPRHGPRPRRSACPERTPGSAGGPRWPQPRGHSLIASARSENASITSSGSMWASPNDRMPGVSTTQPDPPAAAGRPTASTCVAPCPHRRPSPVARSASGTRRFTSVDLPTPEWPSSTVTLSASSGADRLERIVAARDGDGQVEVGELRGERLRGARSVLVRHRIGVQPTGVGGDQSALDQAGARRRVGQRDHDQQLIGVGDDDPFGRIGVIGGAPQHRSPFTAPHDAGQGVGPAGQVARRRRRRHRPRSGCGPVRGPASRSPGGRVAAQHASPPARGRR